MNYFTARDLRDFKCRFENYSILRRDAVLSGRIHDRTLLPC